jgi:Tol biopolymer transport system component
MAERMGTEARRLLALVLVLLAAGCSSAPSTSVTPSLTSPTPESSAVAPEGRIAFTSYRDGNGEIYVMDAAGTWLDRLTHDPAHDIHPAWSPDGTRIAFASDRHKRGRDYDLYAMNADGSGVVHLTDDPRDETEPSWSPDGARIAFVINFWPRPFPFAKVPWIYVMNADGTDVNALTSRNYEFAPSWSPDGAKIAFSRTPGNERNPDIYVTDADGFPGERLTDDPAGDYGPNWSPDGTKIAFSSDRDGHLDLYVMNTDGTGVTQLTDDSAKDGLPTWSPDGTHLAFVSNRDGNNEIYVMGADGMGVTRLTDDPAADEALVWAPTA